MYKELIHNYKHGDKALGRLSPGFLDHTIPILASIKLKRNEKGLISTKATLTSIPEVLETPNGPIPMEEVKSLTHLLYSVNRSDLISTTITKEPRLGTLTPMLLYAHKLQKSRRILDPL